MGFKISPSRFKSGLAVLRQPAALAAVLSVGVHGVLFGAAPRFSSLGMAALGGTEELSEQRNVPLIELTPDEQNRLPDFSSSAYSLFPGSGSPDSFELLPVPRSTTPISPISPPPTGDNSFSALPPNPFAIGMSPYIPPSRPSITSLPPVVRQPSPSRPTPAPGVAQPKPSGATPDTAPSTPTDSTPTAQSPGRNTPTEPGAEALLPPPESNGSANSPTEPLIAAGPEGSGQGTPDRRDLSDQLQALAYNATGTTSEEAAAARQAWIASAQTQSAVPDLDMTGSSEVEITYEGRVCLSPEPVDGLIGVLVQPDGTLGDDPALLKSTGYRFLNEQAASAIAASDFPESAAPVAYEITVKVNYDSESCIDREQILKSRGAAE
ncbi:hypothetical protein [Pseudanabaena sp. FACHB-2040]|uniref:hypothetical protein n=1 Tax=Pseudanabaena sp. FACHB-2040 TaxID=2692859 RepID=UPI0016866428|nr:hypothetical protein [Pseudanabaena sp. FACHB-2040]MBD2258471.1 hypothetical protein [Pseudanabaena sp. FACHB-2040]